MRALTNTAVFAGAFVVIAVPLALVMAVTITRSRARGAKAIFPLLQGDLIDDTTLPILVSGNQAQVDAVLAAGGVSAAAFAAPVFVDFDGGGYRAPFSPM